MVLCDTTPKPGEFAPGEFCLPNSDYEQHVSYNYRHVDGLVGLTHAKRLDEKSKLFVGINLGMTYLWVRTVGLKYHTSEPEEYATFSDNGEPTSAKPSSLLYQPHMRVERSIGKQLSMLIALDYTLRSRANNYLVAAVPSKFGLGVGMRYAFNAAE